MTTHEATKRLGNDLKVVAQDVEDTLKAGADKAGVKMREARSRMTSALENARVECDRLRDRTAKAARKTDDVIRGHPWESIGLALGVGLLLGALMGRR